MRDKINLGFKKNIKLEWMDYALTLVLSGLDERTIRSELRSMLESQLTEQGKPYSKDSIDMIVTILAVWFRDNFEFKNYRDDLLSCANKLSKDYWIVLHWAIFNVAYPLWFQTNMQIGKLLGLQAGITAGQVYDRVKLAIGDTETVKRNTRYVFRTVNEWHILSWDCLSNIYRQESRLELTNLELIALLLESLIIASNDNWDVFELQRNTALFPFIIPFMPGNDICHFSHGRLSNMIYGLDREIISIVKY